ncbi:MAG: hypothetical protein KJ941_02215 [Bacteroidetes bacterium]|nr:hypothetical protein [Bacteroidota bacterium]
MIKYLILILLAASTVSCNKKLSTNELEAYFYPIDEPTTFYVYRDVVNGLDEQIHRIYSIEDSKGKHLVVEVYTGDGRIIEAYNYNVDSLNLIDHMIVNAQGKRQQADLLKNTYFPKNKTDETYFASRFPGFYDSTFILREVKRKATDKGFRDIEVMGKMKDGVVFKDKIRQSLFNPFTHVENVVEGNAYAYFAKGIGLTEWHDVKKKVHFKLEQVLDEKEGLKLLSK